MEETATVLLKNLVRRKIGYGIVQPGDSKALSIPVIKVNNIISGLYSIDALDKTTQTISQKYSRTVLQGGELLVTVVGTIGKTAIVPNSFAGCNIARAVAMIDIQDPTLALWVKYYIDSPQGHTYIIENLNTTVQATLNIKDLENMPVPLYDRLQLERRVAVLRSLDDKIALNNRINHNLEEQAQALYKSWFIDFEPFKDGSFVDSEIGYIPKGWSVRDLLEIATLYDSKRRPLSGKDREKMEKKYPYYGATSVMDYVDDYIFDGIYLLMGEDGSVMTDDGFPFLQYVSGRFWPNNHAHVLQGCNGFSTEMLHCALLRKVIKSSVTGAVQAKISQANMRKILFPYPPKDILNEFDSLIQDFYRKKRSIKSQNETLFSLRDNLLPRLMSGGVII